MPNLILNLIESFNDYLLFNFRFDPEAFHEDCDNKGILYYFYSSKHLILLRFNLSDYAQQFRAK